VNCERHYCLDPLSRFDLDEILMLIDQYKYFILHAPRQTGKTSFMLALMKYLNQNGTTCRYINVETAQAVRENIAKAMRIILCEIALRENTHLKTKSLDSIWIEILEKSDEFALNHIIILILCSR